MVDTSTAGTIAFIGQNVINPLAGNIRLASLSFTGLNLGSSLLGLTGSLDLGTLDATGNNILDIAAASGRVDVVPEPGTFLLLGLGLAGLLGFRKKFQKV